MKRTELVENIFRKGSFLCVGLDPDIKKIPQHLLANDGNGEHPVLRFNKAIIDATAPYCVAYKPNLAFYEALGADGFGVLDATVRYIRANYPDQFIIADAKRGDIGNTAAMYARSLYEAMDFDAVTLAPYMGEDSVRPFLEYKGKWAVILALTSNKSASDLNLSRICTTCRCTSVCCAVRATGDRLSTQCMLSVLPRPSIWRIYVKSCRAIFCSCPVSAPRAVRLPTSPATA